MEVQSISMYVKEIWLEALLLSLSYFWIGFVSYRIGKSYGQKQVLGQLKNFTLKRKPEGSDLQLQKQPHQKRHGSSVHVGPL